MNMAIDIKHKNAGHIVIIKGQAFKANDSGMFDSTDVWQTLKLPKGKAPGRWRGKTKDRLSQSQNLDVRNLGNRGHCVYMTKRAFIEYAGWVSDEFKDMVYDAFEAILEMPKVALLVADKIRNLGHSHSAAILERNTTENQDRNAILSKINRGRIKRPLSPAEKEQQKWLRKAKAYDAANPMR